MAQVPEVQQLSAADVRRVPWRNGRGVTEELALWPPGASLERGDFDWRISRAAVDEDGAFSTIPGCERVLVVTSGAGLVLTHGPHAPRARLRPLEPYRFAGAWPTSAELVAGPIVDFNVMARPERVHVEVEATRLGPRRARIELGAGHAFLHVLAGAVAARLTGEEQPFELGERESLWVRGLAGGEELDLGGTAGCTLLLVRLVPADA